MAKPRVNYWVDVLIGVAFLLSAVSGLVFLLPVGSGSTSILGLAYEMWDALHLWGSLAMIAGVLTHLVLHSKWIVAMTQKTFGLDKRLAVHDRVARPAPTPGSVVNRRRFLTLGAATLVVGAILAGGSAALGAVARALVSVVDDEGDEVRARKAASAKERVETHDNTVGGESEKLSATGEPTAPAPSDDLVSPDDVTPEPEPATEAEVAVDPTATPAPAVRMCLSCPRGLVNDPYPGRCRLYVDRDNDRICDRSVPEPCG
ncbi:MAG: DUF4405 domain-containing protein [Anaerolineae bacterium]|jgi:hypothetical protein|nr:DUF4405 domain-containing protein [Anaerolineae bacterium]